jgi:tetratricopeptide (TPR) repeat protein
MSADQFKKQADRLYQQGVDLYYQQRFEAAAGQFQQALDLYRQGGDRPGEAKAGYMLGLSWSLQGDRPRPLRAKGWLAHPKRNHHPTTPV